MPYGKDRNQLVGAKASRRSTQARRHEDSRSSGLGVSRSSRESSIEAEIGLSEYQVVEIRVPGYQAVKVSIEYQASRKDQAIPHSA